MSSAFSISPPVYLQPSSTPASLHSVQASEPHYPESQPGSSTGTSIPGFHQSYPNHQSQYLASEATQQMNGVKFTSSQVSPNSGVDSTAGSASGSRRTQTLGEEVETNHDDKPYGDDDPASYDLLRVKHRRRTSPQQLKVLEHHFGRNPKPDVNVRKALSEQLEMTPREVQVWFQNRRAKIKKLREKAVKDGIDPASVDGSARVHPEDASIGEQQYWAHADGQNAQEHGTYYESYAANGGDYAHQPDYGFDSRAAPSAPNRKSSQSPPDGYYDHSGWPPSTSGPIYATVFPAHASMNVYGQPTGRGGYPTPTSLRNHDSPLDALPAGLTDGATEQVYVTSQAPQRFSLPAYDGAGTQSSYHSAAEGHHSLAYATPPIDPQLTHVYREYDYISRCDDDEGSDLHEDIADTYSIVSHHHPSTSSFNLPLDPQLANNSRLAEHRGSVQALDQAFDATLNLANGSNANVVTSPTRIGGVAAPQWPVGADVRTAYAAPAFAPSSVPTTEYVYGAWPQTTPAVNYFPTVDRAAYGRRGSLHSIPERSGGIDPAYSMAPTGSIPPPATSPEQGQWLGGAGPQSGSMIDRRGSNASLARKVRSNNNLRTPYPTQDARGRSPTGAGIDARVVQDGLQYVLPTSTTLEPTMVQQA
ncbi:BQ5605_C010g06080 [Microbotryum silenes-dioicae]|uniref:BQ5605_C010g06080 protein n=1 Tax=Microbotryum silenes-dioicae TaxID=796604 RepID=A0A2X0LQF1_9BASI|nr:BQ5605_C010g06080 [Microbotryum silenes-dioicae]